MLSHSSGTGGVAGRRPSLPARLRQASSLRSEEPLLEAAKVGHLREVQRLLEHKGSDVQLRGKDEHTALHWAAWGGHLPIVQYLLDHGAPLEARTKRQDRTALFFAAAQNHLSTVDFLLEKGADVNANSKHDGATALHKAAQQGHEQMVRLLLANGASVNVKDIEGLRPLNWAIQVHRVSMARLLLEAGAKVEGRTDKVCLPSHVRVIPLILSGLHRAPPSCSQRRPGNNPVAT